MEPDAVMERCVISNVREGTSKNGNPYMVFTAFDFGTYREFEMFVTDSAAMDALRRTSLRVPVQIMFRFNISYQHRLELVPTGFFELVE